jgi:hypothetical protein
MRPKVAVATVRGKAYYLIVNELKQRHIPFISLMPGSQVRTEIRAVITTPEEKHLVSNGRIVVLDPHTTNPEAMGREVIMILQGKEAYDQVTIGIDPGDVMGIAVIADTDIIDTENCESVRETANKIRNTLRTIDLTKTKVTIKIGSGVPIYRDMLDTLDAELPPEVALVIVREEGTNRYTREDSHRRGFRHMASAIRIAGRAGYEHPRKVYSEKNL